MRNIRKFNILYIFLIFILIASSMLGVFVSVKTLAFNNKTTESKIIDDITPGIKDPAEDSGKDILANGSKTTSSGYDLDNATHQTDLFGNDAGSNITDDAYNNNTKFVINNLSGLKKFAGIVNGAHRDFKGKEVYLNADIDCGGAAISIGMYYAGDNRQLVGAIFDGQSHTISNFQISNHFYYKSGTSHMFHGFFTSLGPACKVQNLRLQNFKGPSGIDRGVVANVGALVGVAEQDVEIKNCAIEDFVVSDILGERPRVCGIVVASANILIQNCFIKNHNVAYDGEDFAINGGYHFRNCAIGPTMEDSSNSGLTIKIKSCVIYDEGAQQIHDVYYATIIEENCKIGKDNTAGLSCSTIGGNTSTEPTTWYYAHDYNNSFPYLRQFVEKWKYVHFSTDNGTGVSTSSILIPIDANQTFPNPGKNTIKVYNRDIVAFRPDSMCEHAEADWEIITLYTAAEVGTTIYEYICTFTVNKITFNFLVSDNATTYVDGIKQTETKSFTLRCGSQLEYSCVKYSKRLIIKSVTYVFKDSNGVKHEVTYETEGVKYYILSATPNEGGNTHISLNISVETQLKTYNIILK